MQAEYNGVRFSDSDVVDPCDFIPRGDFNPHNVRPWLFHDHGFTLCVVFADSLQDALDKAVDEGKLDRFQIHPEDASERGDYMTSDVSEMEAGFNKDCPEYTDANGVKYWWKYEPAFLGNAGEPFDIENLGVIELPNPRFSFAAMFTHRGDHPQPKLKRSSGEGETVNL